MSNLFAYLLELNIALVVLFAAYKIFFEKDKNFAIRRIYLLGVIVLPFLLPLMPSSLRMPVQEITPISMNLEDVTIFASGTVQETDSALSFAQIAFGVYLAILAFGLIKLLIQLGGILRAVYTSEKIQLKGSPVLANPKFHASSFFSYVFVDPEAVEDESFDHILEHENIHRREWHSIDRILGELFVMINWFNPVAWMFRKSVIQNLEYLADSAVLREGTDPTQYQLSILNQYIGSASISNQFSSQIKNRINMLNKDYKLGSSWKLILIFPLVFFAFFIVSCTDKDAGVKAEELSPDTALEAEASEQILANKTADAEELDGEIFYVVEEMPGFGEGDPVMNFRKYIATNLRYPKEAAENGVTGKIFIRFVVSETGKVVIPSLEQLAEVDQKPIEDVFVVAYRTVEKDQEKPDEKYIDLLKEEVIRVVSESPDWTPGKQRGKPVKVMYTFPVNFILQ
jgi:beta-lactamase regulating signal transducer with metallopeptidase domain